MQHGISMVTIMKNTKNLKIRVGIFKNMGGNIPGGNFPRGSLMGGNIPGGSFPGTKQFKIKIINWELMKRI